MKVSLITVSYNSASTIRDTIESVLSQDYPDIEYIIVDGDSKDATKDIIQSYGSGVTKFLSEPDKGIYDAMNKGIKLATGDVIGMINSDDFYSSSNIISKVAETFSADQTDAIFGDLVFVAPDNLERVVRRYSSRRWNPSKFARGFMPAHPTFFVRRKYYDQFGLFKTDYKIAADYELLIRFLYVHRLNYKYLPLNMVTMRTGGVSSNGLQSNITLNEEIIRGCRENGISTNHVKVYSKYFKKVLELLPWA